MFFGRIIQQGKPYKFNVQSLKDEEGSQVLSITNAILAPASKEPASLFVKMEGVEYLVASLTKEHPQATLNLFVSLIDEAEIVVKGNAVVHVTGYFEPSNNDMVQMEKGQYLTKDVKSKATIKTALEPTQKAASPKLQSIEKKSPKAAAQPAQIPQVAQVEQDEDDEDEDEDADAYLGGEGEADEDDDDDEDVEGEEQDEDDDLDGLEDAEDQDEDDEQPQPKKVVVDNNKQGGFFQKGPGQQAQQGNKGQSGQHGQHGQQGNKPQQQQHKPHQQHQQNQHNQEGKFQGGKKGKFQKHQGGNKAPQGGFQGHPGGQQGFHGGKGNFNKNFNKGGNQKNFQNKGGKNFKKHTN